MSIICYKAKYKNFGECIFIDNGIIKAGAMLESGPRIIYFGLTDGENMLFEDIDRNFSESCGEYGTWYTYGGHRLWCAPEKKPETYFPDNFSVLYDFSDGILTLTAKDTVFGKRFSLILEMTAENTLSIENRILNVSDFPSFFAPWSITAMAEGGREIIPLSSDDCGFLPNRTMALWSYSSLHDERFSLTDSYAELIHKPECSEAFKAGFNVIGGYAGYINGEGLFLLGFSEYENITYPDFCCNYETYVNRHFLECEILGELREYKPGEYASIKETWQAFKIDSSEKDKHGEDAAKLLKRLAFKKTN